jgi:hypothetical protein
VLLESGSPVALISAGKRNVPGLTYEMCITNDFAGGIIMCKLMSHPTVPDDEYFAN